VTSYMVPGAHGLSQYTHGKCRCDVCRAAAASYVQQWRRSKAGSLGRNDQRHGTVNGYTAYACRCAKCSEAMRTYQLKARAS
jgi:hypothetical protein